MGQMRSRGRRRWAGGLAGTLAVATVLFVPFAGAQGDDEGLRYQAFASADAARFGLLVPGASAVDQIIDAGGPVAQAVLNSLGTSAGFASQPYPGELALIGPGLGATLLGLPQPPSYPFIAASRHPSSPEAHVEPTAFYRLFSKSDQIASSAEARSGHTAPDGSSNGGFSQAGASVVREGTRVTAEASNRAEALTAGPLRLGAVVSRAKVGRLAGQDAERQSALEVTGASIGGQAVGFSEEGLVLPGTNAPLPSSDPLLSVLQQARVKVSYLKAEVTPDGVIAPGLQIVTVETLPGADRTVTVSITLGRAAASVEASGEEIAFPAEETGPEATPTEVGGEAAAPAEVAPAAPIPVPEVPAVTGISDVALPVLPSASFTAGPDDETTAAPATESMTGAAALAAPPVQVIQTAGRMAPVGEVSSAAFYPLLVLVGLLVVGGLRFVRGRGVSR
jgi:hypothetical protein